MFKNKQPKVTVPVHNIIRKNDYRAEKFLVTKTTIDIIERETGKSILEIPEKELLKRVRGLTNYDFLNAGLICDSWALKSRLTESIMNGRFPDLVNKIKNQNNKKLRRYSPSINSKRGSIYDIQNNILKKSKNGIKKSPLSKKINFNYNDLIKYLDNLLGLGLIEYDAENRIYKTTELGLDFIYTFQQLRNFLSAKKTDEPVKLDKKSRNFAINALYNNRKRCIYDFCALILINAHQPTTRYNMRLVTGQSLQAEKLDGYIKFLTELKFLKHVENTDSYKTTSLGSPYLEEYLNFILFNYLG